MIEFHHGSQSARLAAGETYAVPVGSAYRDTPEGELLAVVREVEAGTPWRTAVRRRYGENSPWLARIVTDASRGLFFRLHPPAPGARVLDVGAGWGQISLPLAAVHEVTALEPTPERLAFIRAAAAQDGLADRMHFVQADFLDLRFTTRFDVIACIGVLEWVPSHRAGEPRNLQVEFLARARDTLAPGGSLVLGIENRVGLKYLLGARDDHLGVPGIAVLDHALADKRWRELKGEPLRSLTHTRAELALLFAEAGFAPPTFFAAFPDYKVPEVILPAGSEVDAFFASGAQVPEHDGIDGTPLPFQEELSSHYRTLAALGTAADFAPSYYAVASTPC
jgi:2-polyprenyl-3-methyl-5-hydroxy-6-metoxy-1,4-benzoquinol methylase